MWHGGHWVLGSIDLVTTLETLCFIKYSTSLSKNMKVVENYLLIFKAFMKLTFSAKIEYFTLDLRQKAKKR